MRKIIVSIIIFIYILNISIFLFAADTLPVWNRNDAAIMTLATDETVDMKLSSGGAILIEANSGKILYEHNSHEKLRPASVTKIMTILLIMENLEAGKFTLEDKVPCSEIARKMGGSQIWLAENEELSVNDMLKAICIVSANEFAHHNHVMQKPHTKH